MPEGKPQTQQGKADLAAQVEEVVTEYVKKVPTPGEIVDIEPRDFNKLISRLDTVFWKRVDEVVTARLVAAAPGRSTLPFTDDDRLLLDFGLLDDRLMGPQAAGLRRKLLSERCEDAPRGFSIIYLSDWIESRYQYYLTIEEVEQENEVTEYIRTAPELSNLVERRQRIFSFLQPYLEHLPGVSDLLSRFIAEGRLDDLMVRLFLERMSEPSQEVEARLLRIESAYQFVMRKVAARVLEDEHLQLIDECNALRLEIFRHVNRLPKDIVNKSESGPDISAMAGKVRGEIKLIRSLLNLGTLSGAITKPHSVMLRDIPRATVSGVGTTMMLIKETDPLLSLDHNVLIAPFTGNGFFEWDRDTIVVSLIPVRSVDEDVTTAVCSTRIALDHFQHSEYLRRAYEKLYHSRDFRKMFTRDYLQWVLKVGRGQKQQMDARGFDFFMGHIGHNGVDPVVPHEIAHTTVAARNKLFQAVVKKIHDGTATPRDFFVAGVISWLRRDYQSATRYLESAAKLGPEDGGILYSLGILLRNARMKGPAKKYLLQCTREAPQTIWRVYAFEALRKLG